MEQTEQRTESAERGLLKSQEGVPPILEGKKDESSQEDPTSPRTGIFHRGSNEPLWKWMNYTDN